MTEKLPDSTKSLWRDPEEITEYPRLEKDLQVDVCIVGGGITGITAAYLLAKEGLSIAILEADQVLGGTTGHTTAKITAQHDLIYDELITNMGKSKAHLYYEANMEALQFIKQTIETLNIDCGFQEEDAYVYATTEEYEKKIQKEVEAYEKLGIHGELVDELPFELDIKNAIVMYKQAQFHPLKYLVELLEDITKMGGQIYGNTTAVNIKNDDGQPTVLTIDDHAVTCKYVLVCSHFPFYEGMGLYSTRMYADRAYIVAAKTKKAFPGGMYISADQPTRSLRSVNLNGEELLLIVGESHKTGQGSDDTMEHFQALVNFGEEVFGIEAIPYRWSAQDLTTLDKVPYVGEITSSQDHILIATGYRKWGMTHGTAAAILLKDIVTGQKNHFRKLYSPSRFYATPSIKNFLVQNANVVGHLIKGKLEVSNVDPQSLDKDEGAVVIINGERKSAYRDPEGQLHIVDTTCTHIDCEVEWNSGERSWDCPCHGSRFTYTGEVIEGPAEKPLQKYDFKMLDNLTSDDSGY